MDDLISRRKAIDAAECIVEHHSITPYKTMAAAMDHLKRILNGMPSAQPIQNNTSNALKSLDCIDRQAAIDALFELYEYQRDIDPTEAADLVRQGVYLAEKKIEQLPSAQPDTEKICARIKAEAIKRNVEYMKHGDRYMLGFVDGMRLARRIVDGTIDDPVYFTCSGE